MTIYLDRLNNIVWGAPALVLILVVGLYLSFRLGFVQLTLLPAAQACISGGPAAAMSPGAGHA